MTLIKLNAQYLTEITTLFSEVIKKMQEDGINQWDDNYPDNQSIMNDLQEGTLFGILQDEKVIAVVTLNEQYSPQYDALSWSLPTEDYLIVHRLAVHPLHQNKGLAKQIMAFSEEYAREHHYKGIRLDTYSKNPKNLYFYKKLNYKETGEVYFSRLTDSFICYEKIFL